MIITTVTIETTALAGHLLIRVHVEDDDTPLPNEVSFYVGVQVRALNVAWGIDVPETHFIVQVIDNAAEFVIPILATYPGFAVRANGGGGWTADVLYTAPSPGSGTPPEERKVTYASVLRGVATRRGICGELSACQAAEAAEYISSAYRYCLEAARWPEALISEEVACADGLVTWAAIRGAGFYEFWTANPNESESAQKLRVGRRDTSGVWLDTTEPDVWAIYTPRPPVFTHVEVDPLEVYAWGATVLEPVSGDVYECVHPGGASGAALTDTDLWEVRRILWLLAEPTKLLALADWLGNSEQEREQAADLREQVEIRLSELSVTYT